MKKGVVLFSVIFLASAISGCNPYNNAGEGAAVGGSLGALAGGIVGNQSHHHGVEGALIGGALGAITGGAVGSTVQKPNAPAPVVVSQPAPVVVTQPAPVVVVQPAPVVVEPVEAPAVTVNIPNSDGTYTTVLLRRSGYGYVGPQGEYYPHMPSMDQLRAMYGH